MGRARPVTLGRFTYPSIKDAKAALRALRDEHRGGAPILAEDAVDLLLSVVSAHPQAKEKVGAGIAGFLVAKSPDWPTDCFYLRRVDGTETDFSWNEAITPTSPIARLRMACRNAIEGQKTAFKDGEWPLADATPRRCPITGEVFGRAEAHVDHVPPATLQRLVEGWLETRGITAEDVLVNHTGDLRSVDEIADPEFLASWREYHQENTRLRLVSAAGNLRQGARELGL
jgi:hypothetical protein